MELLFNLLHVDLIAIENFSPCFSNKVRLPNLGYCTFTKEDRTNFHNLLR